LGTRPVIDPQGGSFEDLTLKYGTYLRGQRGLSESSGRLLVERLTAAGHRLAEKRIVADDIYQIRAALSKWIADETVNAVITTGGTGVTGRDGTPEAVAPLLDKQISGFGETFRSLSWAQIGTSTIQSRCLAGVANGTYVFVLPGSGGACRTAWDELISAQLDYRTRPCNLVELMPRLREV
jgi:molybdenum cofactor biosynthesis protein B